jgi:hypothetical protein
MSDDFDPKSDGLGAPRGFVWNLPLMLGLWALIFFVGGKMSLTEWIVIIVGAIAVIVLWWIKYRPNK